MLVRQQDVGSPGVPILLADRIQFQGDGHALHRPQEVVGLAADRSEGRVAGPLLPRRDFKGGPQGQQPLLEDAVGGEIAAAPGAVAVGDAEQALRRSWPPWTPYPAPAAAVAFLAEVGHPGGKWHGGEHVHIAPTAVGLLRPPEVRLGTL